MRDDTTNPAAPQALTRIRVEGFRSLREVELQPGRVTVLIGPNGAGKSNLLSFLRMIPLLRTQSLGRFVGEAGGASALLRYGPKVTPQLCLELEFSQPTGASAYHARLGYAAGDSLVFLDEVVRFTAPGAVGAKSFSLGAGHSETRLDQVAQAEGNKTAATVRWLLSRMNFFHFHDTSATSALRQNARAADDRYVRSDGSNLAAFLYRLARSELDEDRAAWRRIHALLRRVAPYIKSLEPEALHPASPGGGAIRLRWTDLRDYRFDVSDLSDGTLRALALITALAQPPESLPVFVCIDEPELGLHPAAVTIFAELVRSVSPRCQVLLATQSPALLDHFAPEEVVVVEQHDGETTLRRLDPVTLEGWLEDYRLSELYDKNLLGGRP